MCVKSFQSCYEISEIWIIRNAKKVGEVILMSDETDFKRKTIRKDKDGDYDIKRSIQKRIWHS